MNMIKPPIDDYQFRVLLDAWMCLDNPQGWDEDYQNFCLYCENLASREAESRGYDSVVDAYHEHPQPEELTDTEK